MSYQRRYNENLDLKSRSQEQSRGAQSQKSVSGKPPQKEDANYVGFLEDKLNTSNKNTTKIESFEKNLHVLVSTIDKMRNQWDSTDDRLYKIENKFGTFEREIDNFIQLGNRDKLVAEVVESLSQGFFGEFRKDLKTELKSELRAEMNLTSGLTHHQDALTTGRMNEKCNSSKPNDNNRLSDKNVRKKNDTAQTKPQSPLDLDINFMKDEILCDSRVLVKKMEQSTNNKLSAMMEELQNTATCDDIEDLQRNFKKLESTLLEEMKYMKKYLDNALVNVNSQLLNNNTNFTGLNTSPSPINLTSNIVRLNSEETENSQRSKSIGPQKENYSTKERGSEKRVRMHINERIEDLGQGQNEYSRTQDLRKSKEYGTLKSNLQKKAYSNKETSDDGKNFDDGLNFKKAVENKLKKEWNLQLDSDDDKTFLNDDVKIMFENYEDNDKKQIIGPNFENKNKENVKKIYNNKKMRSKSNASSAFSEISQDDKTRILSRKEKLVNQTLNSIREKPLKSDRNSVKSLNRTQTRNKSKNPKHNLKESKRSKSKNIKNLKKKEESSTQNLKKEQSELDQLKKKKLDRKNKIGNLLRK